MSITVFPIMNTTGTGQANSTSDTQAHNINQILPLHNLNPDSFLRLANTAYYNYLLCNLF